jgi:hypothetical protein
LCYTSTLIAQDLYAQPRSWDERYTPFIRRAGFLPLAHLVPGHLPMMDSIALMTLVARWRLETHTFHLPWGETTVTLQNVAMTLGLPIDGAPFSRTVSPAGWRDSVAAAIGL